MHKARPYHYTCRLAGSFFTLKITTRQNKWIIHIMSDKKYKWLAGVLICWADNDDKTVRDTNIAGFLMHTEWNENTSEDSRESQHD